MLRRVYTTLTGVAVVLCAFFFSPVSLNAQSNIGMELRIPVEARIDTNGVEIRTPFADKKALKKELYLESHIVNSPKISKYRSELNNTNSAARKEKVYLVVHYL